MLALIAALALAQSAPPLTPGGPAEEAAEELEDPYAVAEQDVPSAAALHRQPKSMLARIELVGLQTLHGLICGGIAASGLRVSGEGQVGLLLAGSALGLGASLYFSSGGVAPGAALAVDSSTAWGHVFGALLGQAFLTTPDWFAVELLGGLAGVGLGALLFARLDPTAGQVALINSGGIWALVFASWALENTQVRISGPTQVTWYAIEASALAVGLGGAAVAAHFFKPSRLRMFLIDLGGGIGFAVGSLLNALVGIGARRDSPVGIAGPIGFSAVGMGTAAWLSREL